MKQLSEHDLISLNGIISEMKQEMMHILNYWMDCAVDEVYGGFFGARDHFNNLIKDAPKGIILNARILYTFSLAYRKTDDPALLVMAERAYEYLKEYFHDHEHGGYYWELDHQGNVLNARKHSYAQAFVIYGLSEYYDASRNREAYERAMNLFLLLEEHAHDDQNGGYIESLNREWGPEEDMSLSPTEANEPKSMNTHLHLLEAYGKLFRVGGDPEVAEKLNGLLELFLEQIIDKETRHFIMFFGMGWDPRSALVSYGHDIEGSWLLYEAAEYLGEEQLLRRIRNVILEMAEVTYKEGTDRDGGIIFEYDAASGNYDYDKHWWPQAEAMVGFLNAWQLTGRVEYLKQVFASWRFIRARLIDRQNGEWFWRVDRQGQTVTSEVKMGFWKAPYHNTRALLEVTGRLQDFSAEKLPG